MGVALFGADILSVHAALPGEALCSLYLKAQGKLSLGLEPASGVRRGSLVSEDCTLRFTDVMHRDIPVFARQIECFDTVYFGLSVPPDVTKRYFKKGGNPSLLISSRAGHICITLRGGAFLQEGIRFASGKSEIYVTALTGNAKAGLPGVPPAFRKLYEETERDADLRISTPELRDIVNRICGGGVLRSFAEGSYHTEEQYQAVKALCEARLFTRAKGIINFMLGIYRTCGQLPMIYGERPVYDPFPAIRASYLALALKEYYDRSGDRRYIKSTLYEVSAALTYILDCVNGSRLPHLGNEGVYGKDLLLPSSKSEELTERALEAVKQMSEETRTRICCKVSLNDAPKSKTRKRPPRALRTLCERCGKEGVCYLGKDGDYLCPECYIE